MSPSIRIDHVAIVLVSSIGITFLVLAHDLQAPQSLVATTILLMAFGFFNYGYLMDPTWHQWVCNERGNMSVIDFKNCPVDDMISNLLVDVAGNVATTAFMACTFQMTTINQAAQAAFFLYMGAILPNFHHYLWEGRATPLLGYIHLYGLAHRILGACALVFFASFFGESLPSASAVTFQETLVIPVRPVALNAVLRFLSAGLWFGPLFGFRVWLPAMRDFLRNPKFPETQGDMPKLMVIGVACGILSSFILMQLQASTDGKESFGQAMKFGFQLWFFYILPNVSVDCWEGKPYALSFVNYSLYLVQLLLMFGLNYLLS